MSETQPSPETTPAPAPSMPGLVQTARVPFRALLWVGLGLVAIGAIAFFIGLSQNNEYGAPSAGPFVFAAAMVLFAMPLIAAAGIVAGLGEREAGNDS